MPLTMRQFELGIDDGAESWMRSVYNLLAERQELAYSSQELEEFSLEASSPVLKRDKFRESLDVLVRMGAVEKRWVDETDYYAFSQRFETKSWQPDLSEYRV